MRFSRALHFSFVLLYLQLVQIKAVGAYIEHGRRGGQWTGWMRYIMMSTSTKAVAAAAVTVSIGALFASLVLSAVRRNTKNIRKDYDQQEDQPTREDSKNETAITKGGYESLIGNTPLVYLPHLSSLINNNNTDNANNGVRIYAKMENLNPGGTGKDRAARSMILAAEEKGELPPPLSLGEGGGGSDRSKNEKRSNSSNSKHPNESTTSINNGNINDSFSSYSFDNIPPNIHKVILQALHNTQTHGILIEGTSGSTGISLSSISSSRGHASIVVMPDDQSSQKKEFLQRLGCGVVVVKNCSISNPGHYVNVARRVWELVEVERRYDGYYWENVVGGGGGGAKDDGNGRAGASLDEPPRLLKAAFMNQFENLANVQSHYSTTGPEIYNQLYGKVDAFIMSAGTGGTLVGVGGYLKDRWWRDQPLQQQSLSSPPKNILVDPPGSSLYNKVKYGVAYAPQQSEQRLRRHRYDTIAEGIGLDRVTGNFGLGCESIVWKDSQLNGGFGGKLTLALNDTEVQRDNSNNTSTTKAPTYQSKIIDDALSITDQQAVYMAHYLLRHEGLFVGSSSAMNIAGALIVASTMPPGSNVVTVVCDGGQRHTARFWNRTFVEESGLFWPGGEEEAGDANENSNATKKNDLDILEQLGVRC